MDFDTDNSSYDGNPAWNEFLDAVPAEYHDAVTPILQKWDSGVNDRFQKIHNEYADYKTFKDNGYAADDINTALGIAQALNDNPQDIFNSLGEYYGFFDADYEDQEDVDDEGDNRAVYDPRYANLEEGYNLLAEAVLQQERVRQEAYEDQALDRELTALEDKYGDFDEEFVLTQMVAREVSAEDAVKMYFDFTTKHNRPRAPRIFSGSGGGIPQSGKKLDYTDAKTRKEVGVAYLEAMLHNR